MRYHKILLTDTHSLEKHADILVAGITVYSFRNIIGPDFNLYCGVVIDITDHPISAMLKVRETRG